MNFSDTVIDFIATISFLESKNGGIKSPISSGYRPQLKFEFIEKQVLCEQLFMNDELVFAGDTLEAGIRLFDDTYFKNKLNEGTAFDCKEGEKVVGSGIIKSITNKALKK